MYPAAVNVVIGSGPAGTAAATALLERGEQVTVLNAGGGLEPDRQTIADRLSATKRGVSKSRFLDAGKWVSRRFGSHGFLGSLPRLSWALGCWCEAAGPRFGGVCPACVIATFRLQVVEESALGSSDCLLGP
jgi:choline dehydrogenase-like flavoprotein